jgi:WD40 repeat protein
MLVAWSQDGKYVAIANAGESADLSKEYVGVYTGDLSGTAPGYSQPIQVGGLSIIKGIGWVGSRYITTASDPIDKTTQDRIQIGLWDITQPKLQPNPALINDQLLGGTFSLSASQLLAVSPDSQYVALPLSSDVMVGKVSLNGNNVQWQQVGGIFKIDANIPYTADAVAWSSNSRFLIAIDDAQPGKLVGWDMRHLNVPAVPFNLPGSNTVLTTLACSPIAGISSIAAASNDGTVYLWENFASNTSFNPTRALHSGSVKSTVTALAWSADGQWLAASYKDTNDTILVWKL